MSKNNKSTSKNNKQTIAKDMWQNLLNNPLPNPTSPNTQASGSSSQPNTQPTGFANFPPIASPFTLDPHDPRNNYAFQGWYTNTQSSPPQSQFPHHTQWSQPQWSQNTQWSPQQMNFTVPQTLEESSDEANPEPETRIRTRNPNQQEKG